MQKTVPKSVLPASPATTLAGFRKQMEGYYGNRITRREDRLAFQTIPTGSIGLDMATRVGGWVRGRVHEVVGQAGVGKTTLCISSMREAQRKFDDRAVMYIDMEQSYDEAWATLNGLNSDESAGQFVHEFPDHSEMAADMLAAACDTKLFSLIVLDSIGGMETKAAFEKGASESNMGKGAQVITRMTKRAVTKARQNGIGILFVNQLRKDFNPNAKADMPAGPKILRYMSTMRVDLNRTGETALKMKIDGEDQEIANQFMARVKRNKVAMDGPSAAFYILKTPTEKFGPAGIYRIDEAFTVGRRAGIILPTTEGGHHFMAPGLEKAVNGEAAVKEHFRAHPEYAEKVLELALATRASDVHEETEVSFIPEFSDEINDHEEAS